MASEYMDLIEDVIEDLRNSDSVDAYFEEDGDGYSDDGYILLIDSYGDGIKTVNDAIKEALIEAGIISEEEAEEIEDNAGQWHKEDAFLNYAVGDSNWGYRDSYMSCETCGKYYNSESWDCSVSWYNDFCECEDCIRNNPESYIDFLVESEGNEENRVLDAYALEDAGFEEFDNSYYGIYSDHDSGSEKVDAIHKLCPDAEVIIEDTWTTYVRNFEEPEGWGRIELDDVYDNADWAKYIVQELGLDSSDEQIMSRALWNGEAGKWLGFLIDNGLSDEAIEKFKEDFADDIESDEEDEE